MEVRPSDLGESWHIAVVRLRAKFDSSIPDSEKHVGRLGRRWIRGLGLSQKVAATTLPMTSGSTGSVIGAITSTLIALPVFGLTAAFGMHNPEVAAVVFAGTAALGWLSMDTLPRRVLRDIHYRPLNGDELKRMRAALASENAAMPPFWGLNLGALIGERLQNLILGGDAAADFTVDNSARVLEDNFLALVEDVMRTEVHAPEAEAQLRQTLTLLGEAVMNLPLPPGSANIPEDATDLLADAEMLIARARRESDRVIADSLARQAEAKAAQATAVRDASRLTRRTRILRDELKAQIAATRAALPTLSQSGGLAAAPSSPLRRVADSVQAVAREAASVFAAREELAAALSEPVSAAPVAETTANRSWSARASVTQPEEAGPRLRIGRR